MSLTKRYANQLEEEKRRKTESLLEVPEAIAENHELIGSLKEQLSRSEIEISELNQRLQESNSFKSKIKDYLVGGLVGAILGALLSAVL